MSALLKDLFKEKVSKMKDKSLSLEAQTMVGYPTGISTLDYKNGTEIVAQDMEGNTIDKYDSLGFQNGSMNTIIGKSGSGKTAFAVKAAATIVDPFPNAMIIHDDIEAGTNTQRIRQLTGWNNPTILRKYLRRDAGITAENFYQRIKILADGKLEKADTYTYDTGLLDEFGETIHMLEPTVVILDSLALLMPGKYTDEDELSGQMSATAAAKANAAVFKRLVPVLKQANIILMIINHINQKIEINAFAKTQAQVNYLKQDESLPGGNAAIYLSNNIIKITTSTKISTEAKSGFRDFDGFYAKATIIKSRTNKAGQEALMVYNQDYGFSDALSRFVTMKDEAGLILGKGSMYLESMPDVKFTYKNFLEKLNDPKNIEFKKEFYKVSNEYMKTWIPSYDSNSKFTNNTCDYVKLLEAEGIVLSKEEKAGMAEAA